MKTTTSKKISIALLIANIAFIAICLIMFFVEKAFGVETASNTTYASLITLGFGGGWKHSSYEYINNYGGNPAFAIAFIFVIIAFILSIVLLYGYLSKKFLPKTCLNMTSIIIVLMLFVSVVICFTRQAAASIMAQESSGKKIDFLQLTKMSGTTIAVIVSGFLSIASYVAFALIPFIKNKFNKK